MCGKYNRIPLVVLTIVVLVNERVFCESDVKLSNV